LFRNNWEYPEHFLFQNNISFFAASGAVAEGLLVFPLRFCQPVKAHDGGVSVIAWPSIPGTFLWVSCGVLVFVIGQLWGSNVGDAGLLSVDCHSLSLGARWRCDQFRSQSPELSRNSGLSRNHQFVPEQLFVPEQEGYSGTRIVPE
jgi:hypothetical protein